MGENFQNDLFQREKLKILISSQWKIIQNNDLEFCIQFLKESFFEKSLEFSKDLKLKFWKKLHTGL